MTVSLTPDRTKFQSFREKFPNDSFAFLVIKHPRSGDGPNKQSVAGGASLTQLHETVVRGTLSQFGGSEEVARDGDQILVVFSKPAEAIKFALLLRANLLALTEDTGQSITDRFAIHLVEIVGSDPDNLAPGSDLLEREAHFCCRLADFCQAKQILTTGPAFDAARQSFKKDDLKKEDSNKIGALCWMKHGRYQFAGSEHAVEICEVAESKNEAISPPPSSEAVCRQVSDDDTSVWGWRPALTQAVPGTNFILEERAADGPFGEVWIGKDERANQRRMFRFCVHKEWVRQLKEQENVFKALKKVGENRNVVSVHASSLDNAPYYLMTDCVEGKDLKSWAEEIGGLTAIPLTSRLEVIAQFASGLQAVHEAGIVHQLVRPKHILVAGTGASLKDVHAMVADIGTGHIGPQEAVPEAPPPETIPPPPKPAPSAGASQSGQDAPAPQPPPRPEHMYWAPELIAGGGPTVKSDTYALGVVLSQMLLGSFSELLAPDRIKEIVGGLKREKLPSYFAENAAERSVGAGNIAGELRAVIKERESRMSERRKVTPKQLAWSLATIGILLCVGIIGQTYYAKVERLHKAVAAVEASKGRKLTPEEKTALARNEPLPEEAGASSPLSQAGKVDNVAAPDEPADESAYLGPRSRGSGTGSIKKIEKKKEVESTGAQLFKFLILPIIVVVVVGTIIQNFGETIMGWFRGPADAEPPKS